MQHGKGYIRCKRDIFIFFLKQHRLIHLSEPAKLFHILTPWYLIDWFWANHRNASKLNLNIMKEMFTLFCSVHQKKWAFKRNKNLSKTFSLTTTADDHWWNDSRHHSLYGISINACEGAVLEGSVLWHELNHMQGQHGLVRPSNK